jgi:beta-galactosidase
MGLFKDVDPSLSRGDLDVFTWTTYPVHGNITEFGFRMGDPYAMSFTHDYMRTHNGLSGLMELQPGQVNWGQVNPWPHPGAIRMWILRAFGSGAQLVCTYRYRQPIYGGELYHKGIVEPDGVTLSPGGKEYIQAQADIASVRKHFNPKSQMPRTLAARRTAFVVEYDDRWDIENHRQTVRWDTNAHWAKYYRALKMMMAPVDVAPADLDSYPFVVAPANQLIDKQWVDWAKKYASNGGHLILSSRTGHKDKRGHLFESLWAEPIHDLIGASIPIYDLLAGQAVGKVEFEGKQYAWGSWGDVLEPQAGTTVLARYADQFYAGRAAAITRKLGKGSVTYIGADSLDGELERSILQRVYGQAGAAPQALPPGLVVDWRDGFWVATNFSEKALAAPAGANAKFLLGGRQLDAAGVAVWTE